MSNENENLDLLKSPTTIYFQGDDAASLIRLFIMLNGDYVEGYDIILKAREFFPNIFLRMKHHEEELGNITRELNYMAFERGKSNV